jgi:hypothetical protein
MNNKGSPSTRDVLGPDGPPVSFHYPLADGKPEAQVRVISFLSKGIVENPVKRFTFRIFQQVGNVTIL